MKYDQTLKSGQEEDVALLPAEANVPTIQQVGGAQKTHRPPNEKFIQIFAQRRQQFHRLVRLKPLDASVDISVDGIIDFTGKVDGEKERESFRSLLLL